MSYQEIFNILLGLVAFFGGMFVKTVSSDMKDTKKEIGDLAILVATSYVKKDDLSNQLKEIISKLNKLQDLEVLMATEYSRKDDVEKLGEAIFKKLDRIEEKLDKKSR